MIFLNNRTNPYIILSTASLFFLFTFLQTSLLNSISTNLLEDFRLTTFELSKLSSLYFFASAVFFIPVGIAFDYFSTRKIILLGFIIALLGALLFSSAHTYTELKLARFLSGISYDFALLGCFRLAWLWMPKKIAFALGVSTAIALFGNLLAQIPIIYITQSFGWHSALWIIIGLGIFFFLLSFFFIQDSAYFKIENHNIDIPLLFKNLFLYTPRSFQYAIYACFLNTPILFLGDLWGDLYLTQTYHLNNQQAAKVISILFLGLIVGCPIIGFITDYLKNRRGVMIINALLMLIFVMPLFKPITLSFSLLMLISFSLGFFASTQALCYPSFTLACPPILSGLTSGILSTLIMLGNSILQWLFVRLINFHWNPMFVNNIPYYLPIHYLHALIIMPLAFVVCFLITLFN